MSARCTIYLMRDKHVDSRARTDELQEAMANCAAEPVHAPGAIQDSGCLFCLDAKLSRTVHVSVNVDRIWGITADEALSRPPHAVLGRKAMHNLRKLGHDPMVFPVGHTIHGKRRSFLLTAYRSAEHVVVEAEPLGRLSQRVLSTINEWLAYLATLDNEVALLNALTQGVQALTGHDRVMVYAFDADWNGSVVAESLAPPAESFLGHHFPASDIPAQVRQLYHVNPVRFIAKADAPSVPLHPTCEQALDLSHGTLRAVSPIHATYLQNMGVHSALSLAIHDEDKLWGLLSCHDLSARSPLSPVLRDATRTLVHNTTQRLFLLRARERSHYLQRVMDKRPPLHLQDDEAPRGPAELIENYAPDWLKLLGCDGLAVLYGRTTHATGKRPSTESLRAMAQWLTEQPGWSGYWFSEQLSTTPLATCTDENSICGMLAVPIPGRRTSGGWLLLFRSEYVQHRRWAGNPVKTAAQFEGKLMLTPRRSFAAWEEKLRGHSRAWQEHEIQAAEDLAEDLAVAFAMSEIERLNERLSTNNQRLRTLAHTDPLTGVWNRYRTELAIDTELASARRYATQYSLLLLDIDHFKAVNDTHGHEAGDDVLARLTHILSSSLRESDHIGRWGGEEFVVLATHTEIEQAAELAERLRQTIAGTNFGAAGAVSISIGVSQAVESDTRKSLVARADKALYQAKQNGRNQVCIETASDN